MRRNHRSDQWYRRDKKREFRRALCALGKLEQESLRLPDEVCLKIWHAVKEVESAQDLWVSKHGESVVGEDVGIF